MAKRVIVAGVVAGVAMFFWMSLAHVVLPLGEVGISQISKNEDNLLASMHAALGEVHGLYLFPAVGNNTDANAMQQYAQKIANGPSGMLIYHPSGGQALAPGQLVTEFLSEVLEALLAVFFLSQTRIESFGSRVGFMAIVGIFASLPTNISYWNWYGFPTSYTVTYMLVQVVGFIVVGVVAAAMMRTRVRVAETVPA